MDTIEIFYFIFLYLFVGITIIGSLIVIFRHSGLDRTATLTGHNYINVIKFAQQDCERQDTLSEHAYRLHGRIYILKTMLLYHVLTSTFVWIMSLSMISYEPITIMSYGLIIAYVYSCSVFAYNYINGMQIITTYMITCFLLMSCLVGFIIYWLLSKYHI